MYFFSKINSQVAKGDTVQSGLYKLFLWNIEAWYVHIDIGKHVIMTSLVNFKYRWKFIMATKIIKKSTYFIITIMDGMERWIQLFYSHFTSGKCNTNNIVLNNDNRTSQFGDNICNIKQNKSSKLDITSKLFTFMDGHHGYNHVSIFVCGNI